MIITTKKIERPGQGPLYRRLQMPETVRPIQSAIAVSNLLIDKNQTDQSELTPLKLQKILYFAQGWHLAYFDYPLFEDPVEV
ncbi:MAG: hypothetical protein LBT40_00035 [Deltaproteobacteria bacterium]|nr:hypothetical protein [Deltaproteobacteria bacterium]